MSNVHADSNFRCKFSMELYTTEIKITCCYSNGSNSPHCHWAWMIQLHLPGVIHMYHHLKHGSLDSHGILIDSAIFAWLTVITNTQSEPASMYWVLVMEANNIINYTDHVTTTTITTFWVTSLFDLAFCWAFRSWDSEMFTNEIHVFHRSACDSYPIWISAPHSLLVTSCNCRSSEIHHHVCLHIFVLAQQKSKKLKWV